MKKNIVFLVMDTARSQNFGCYGYDRDTTPFIDNLAEEGVLMKNAVANAPWTLPSHYSFFTGKYPHEHKKLDLENFGGVEHSTVPDILSQEGYKTVGISSNGFISNPYGFEDLFDEFYFNESENENILFDNVQLWEDIKKGEREDWWEGSKDKYWYLLKESIVRREHRALLNGAYYLFRKKFPKKKDFGDSGAQYAFEKVKKSNITDSEDPFFLFVNYVEPHDPYLPPEDYAKQFLDVGLTEARKIGNIEPIEMMGEEDKEIGEVMEDLYDAEIKYLDSKIKELYDYLEKNSGRENIYILLGDHGELFGYKGRWGHQGGIYENLIDVPLIINGVGAESFDEMFELKELYHFIKDIAYDQLSENNLSQNLNTGKFAVSEYKGMNSHVKRKDAPEGFNNNLVSVYSDSGQLILSQDDAETLGEIDEIKAKKFIQAKIENLDRFLRDKIVDEIEL